MIDDCIKGTWLEALRKVELPELTRPLIQKLWKLALERICVHALNYAILKTYWVKIENNLTTVRCFLQQVGHKIWY